MWYAWNPKMVINENPEMFLRKPFMKLVKKNTKGNTEEPSMLSWEKTFMVMVENPFMVIVRTINVKSQKSNNDLLETTNGITQKHNNGK